MAFANAQGAQTSLTHWCFDNTSDPTHMSHCEIAVQQSLEICRAGDILKRSDRR